MSSTRVSYIPSTILTTSTAALTGSNGAVTFLNIPRDGQPSMLTSGATFKFALDRVSSVSLGTSLQSININYSIEESDINSVSLSLSTQSFDPASTMVSIPTTQTGFTLTPGNYNGILSIDDPEYANGSVPEYFLLDVTVTISTAVITELRINAIELVYLINTSNDLVTVGTVPRTIADKFQETISVKDYGAVGDGITDDTSAFEEIVASGYKRIYVPSGHYKINSEMVLGNNVVVYGDGDSSVIEQTVWGYGVIQFRGQGCCAHDLLCLNTRPKTPLSTSLSQRYEGDVSRQRSTGVYVLSDGNCRIENVRVENFVNAVTLLGPRIWTINQTISGATTTTFPLSTQDQQADGYYVGSLIRVLGGPDTSVVTIIAYIGNVVTVSPAWSAANNGSGIYYLILTGKGIQNRINNVTGINVDFGVIGIMQQDCMIDGLQCVGIVQTQEANARPHAIYFADRMPQQTVNLTVSNCTTNGCDNGSAYKFASVLGLTASNMHASGARGVMDIEECVGGTIVGLCGSEMGTAAGMHGMLITSCDDMVIDSVNFTVDSTYDNSGDVSDLRPAGLWFTLTNSNIRVNNVAFTNPAVLAVSSIGILGDGTGVGDAALDISSLTVNGTGTSGATAVRIASGSAYRVRGVRTIGCNKVVQYDAGASDCVVSYESYLTNVIAANINSGSNCRIIMNDEISGTWTPILVGNSTPGTNTYSVAVGNYRRNGAMVYIELDVRLTNLASVGSLYFSGIPYPATTASGSTINVCTLGVQSMANVSGLTFPLIGVVNNASQIRIVQQLPTGYSPGATGWITNTNFTNTTQITMCGWYKTDAVL